ncbi:hypothetical protein V6Z11_D02G164800 [Gossypium hirsutum]
MIVEGLCCIHEKGYVDCDIKPENITDFGLAKEPGERDEDAIVSPYSRGTLNYMSPASVMNGKISAAMDIWSLGCVIAEMCGEPPLEGMAMKAPDIIPKHISMAGKDFSMR